MKNLLFAVPFFAILTFSNLAVAHTGINPFTTDGCSRYADGPITREGYEWLHCCEQHDIRYWSGLGGEKAQDQADVEIRQCIIEAGFPVRAEIIYAALLAARPINSHTKVSFRWGYGWDKQLHHRQLTNAELESVQQMTFTIGPGIVNYRNSKGFPPMTEKQHAAVESIIDEVLTTEKIDQTTNFLDIL